MVVALSKRALILAFSVCLAGWAAAQYLTLDPNGGSGGRPPASSSRDLAPLSVTLGTISHSLKFDAASLGGGAVGLRNRKEGGIEVSGVKTPMKRALIYWAVITQGAPTTAVDRIEIKRATSTAAFSTLVGTKVGEGGSPCWGGNRNTVYRADIPLSIATGNGAYLVRLKAGGNGRVDGTTPWSVPRPPLPLFEGASIVLVGTGDATIAVYDSGIAGKMFFDDFTYKLASPVSVANATRVFFRNIGADGQIGVEYDAVPESSSEVTRLNGRIIAGPGSQANDSDWNGGVAGPLPQLWDDTMHLVTTEAKVGSSPTLMSLKVSAPDDCLVPVANILSVSNAP